MGKFYRLLIYREGDRHPSAFVDLPTSRDVAAEVPAVASSYDNCDTVVVTLNDCFLFATDAQGHKR